MPACLCHDCFQYSLAGTAQTSIFIFYVISFASRALPSLHFRLTRWQLHILVISIKMIVAFAYFFAGYAFLLLYLPYDARIYDVIFDFLLSQAAVQGSYQRHIFTTRRRAAPKPPSPRSQVSFFEDTLMSMQTIYDDRPLLFPSSVFRHAHRHLLTVY